MSTATQPESQTAGQEGGRLLTFASGGWVLLLTGLIALGLLAWGLAPAIMRSINRPPGDGKNIESYGFDLSNLLVDRDLVVPAMHHRDMAPPMLHPTATGPDPALPIDDPARWKSMQRKSDPKYGKYLVPSDLVIGVEINGEARAYPMAVMYVHEIINDTVGGVPIAVTYHWPCDSIVVFDRRVGEATLEFGVSGLVYNSNMLLYDRAPHAPDAAPGNATTPTMGKESLWSQLGFRAVSGPATTRGDSLRIIPATLASWGNWSSSHPHTTVLDRDLSLAARYKRAAPTTYFGSTDLLFPFRPAPPDNGLEAKTPMLAVIAGPTRRVYPVAYLVEQAAGGEWIDTLGSTTVRFTCDVKSRTLSVQAADAGKDGGHAVHVYWFAWHAMHPDDPLVERE